MNGFNLEPTGIAILAAVVIGAIGRNRSWNNALVLLFAGIGVGFVTVLLDAPYEPPNPELVLIAILAPLVFGEALTSSLSDIRRVASRVGLLAIGLVLIGAAAVGVVATILLPGISVPLALCLGAILGPTDAVSVAAVAKSVGMPRRLQHVLEGESLLNDGTALSLLKVCSSLALGGSLAASEIFWISIQAFGGGLLVGAIVGVALVAVARRSADVTVTNGLVLLSPWPIYGLAEGIGGSGILAVVVAGLIFAQQMSSQSKYRGRLQAMSIWRAVAFILQSGAFFLVGMEIPGLVNLVPNDQLGNIAAFVAVALVVVTATRFLFIFIMSASNGDLKRHPREWVVLSWAGTRGPISVLAAFTVPVISTENQAREVVITAAAGFVAVSLLLSTTLPLVVRWAKLAPDDDGPMLGRAEVSIARAALNRLQDIQDQAERGNRPIPSAILENLRTTAEIRMNSAAREEEAVEEEKPVTVGVRSEVGLQMIHAEQEELIRLRDEEGLPDSVMRTLQLEIDIRRRALSTDTTH